MLDNVNNIEMIKEIIRRCIIAGNEGIENNEDQLEKMVEDTFKTYKSHFINLLTDIKVSNQDKWQDS